MLHASLWVAGLLGCLSLIALVAALGGRSSQRWKVIVITIAAGAVPLLFSVGAVVAAAWLRAIGSEPSWLAYALGWQGAFALGAAAILLLAIRRREDGSLASGSWRRLPLLGACLLGVIGFFLALGRLDASRRVEMEAQYRAARETLASFARPPVPETENAAPHYARAFELIEDLGIIGDFAGEVFEPGFDAGNPKNTEARENTAQREAALQALRPALAFPHMREDNEPIDGTNWLREGHALHFRDASVLLALDARTRASAGDLEAAASSAAALWRLTGHALEATDNLVQFLTACAIGEGASQILEDLLAVPGHSEPPPSAMAPPSDLVFHASTAREIERERALLAGFLLQVLGEAKGTPQHELPGIDRVVNPGPLGRRLNKQYLALYRCFVLPGDLALLESRMATLATLAARPWPEARRGLLELEEELQRRPGGVFTGMLLPAVTRLIPRATSADAHILLTRAGLAAATFRARRGAYPARIDDLVPEFLPVIPLDPFDGKPLKLAAPDGGLILYSLGEDGIDDGGVEPKNPGARKGDIAFRLGAAYAARRERDADSTADGDSTEE